MKAKTNVIKVYEERKQRFEEELKQLKKSSLAFGLGRLSVFLGALVFIFFGILNGVKALWIVGILLFLLFPLLIRFHDKIKQKISIQKNLIRINAEEIEFLESGKMPFKDGKEFTDPSHYYSYDLDIFGPRSLFQYLNRTGTPTGHNRLAEDLLTLYPNDQIERRQQAVNELSHKIDFRQKFAATADFISGSESETDFLRRWSERETPKVRSRFFVIAAVLTLIFCIAFTNWIMHPEAASLMAVLISFSVNLGFFSLILKKINVEIEDSDRIDEMTSGYALLLKIMEEEHFETAENQRIQSEILDGKERASRLLQKLSRHFAELNSAENFLVKILFDGTFFYHLYVYAAFCKWKAAHGKKIFHWLNLLGEMEAMNALANFSFNRPDYIFPSLNQENKIEFKELGHPLIPEEKRVCNDISFEQRPFSILTGSNMSGKSTFLRTLGVNMVLAGCGSPVCAEEAEVSPLPVLVSMRGTDSLADEESYFFAEVKRLKKLTDFLSENSGFILLDEILRGTNSDDKQSGTIGVIHKLMKEKAIGMIATHDKEICRLEEEFPERIINRNFEVEILEDELHFDYKLREGICQNQSATFLMRKMGIIK